MIEFKIDEKYENATASNPVERAAQIAWGCTYGSRHRLTCDPLADKDCPIAIVGTGPSLKYTWEELQNGAYVVMSTSGAHKFLYERHIRPDLHVDIDPRPHKALLLGTPTYKTEYYIAAVTHPVLHRALDHDQTTLIHTASQNETIVRAIPRGEWAFTGGSAVGGRAMALARFLGYRDIHLFGMDAGAPSPDTTHAIYHPHDHKADGVMVVDGVTWFTTPTLVAAAQGVLRTRDKLYDARVVAHGSSLMKMLLESEPAKPANEPYAYKKELLLSPAYLADVHQMLDADPFYGQCWLEPVVSAFAARVAAMRKAIAAESVLEYTFGRSPLAGYLDFPTWQYDIAARGYNPDPRPADLVAVPGVLERIEHPKLYHVLRHLALTTKKLAYVSVHTVPAKEQLPSGENVHKTVMSAERWTTEIERHLPIVQKVESDHQVHFILGGNQWTRSESS